MKFLEKFTPAENYLILENSKASLKELLKLTMLDLLLKKVIITEIVVVKSDERSPDRTLTYVKSCINFQSYQPKSHEEIFLSIFQADPDNKILFKHLVKMSYDEAESTRNFVYHLILNHSETSNLFEPGKMFRIIRLNDAGRRAKIQIGKDLNELKSAVINDTAVLTKVNGNLFLINNLESRTGSTGYRGYYRTYSSDFDSAFDSSSATPGSTWFGGWGSDSLTGK